MKRARMVIFLLLGMIVNVFAQKTSKFEVYGSAGISFPIGPENFSKYWKMGFNFGNGIGYSLNPNLTLITYFDFNSFSLDGDKFSQALQNAGLVDPGTSISGGGISIYTISENLKMTLPTGQSPVHPYICGGEGLFELSAHNMKSNNSELEGEGYSETDFSVLFGVGADIAMGERVSLFVEVKDVIGFTEDENMEIFPIKIGIIYKEGR